MTYQIFDINDYKILAPLKCGTRYLEMCLGKPETTTSYMFKETLVNTKIKKIIIREPYEHMISALHTLILTEIQENHLNKSTEIEHNDLNKQTIPYDDVFKKYFNQLNSINIEEQNGHWSNSIYKELYFYWRRNRGYVDILHLNDLTDFLKQEGFSKVKFKASDYNFNNYNYWCSKEDLMLFIMENYENEWVLLMLQIDESNIWYNRLMDKEVIEIKLI